MTDLHPLVALMREDGFLTTENYVPDGDITVDPDDETETQVLISDHLMPGVGVDVVFALARSVPGEHHTAHYHPHGSEIYYLTRGQIEMRLGDDWFTATAGMAIFIPPGTIHETKNLSDEVCEIVVVCGGPTYASLGLVYV